MINLFEPVLGKDELSAIKAVFDSRWIGKGRQVKNFEIGFAQSLRADERKFVSTTSCTEGIFLAVKLLNLKAGDSVIVPTISFPSVASSILEAGGEIIFCDVNRFTLNPELEDIEKVYTPSCKAVFLTHYGGFPIDMDPILEFCKKHDILVIEDSACAVRSFYKGNACGTLGDIGIWSFDAMKTLTTVDGGMMYVRDQEMLERAKQLLYLGLPIKEKSGLDSSQEGNTNWWEFTIESFGRRAIMNDVTAAIGNVQLKKLAGFLSRRREIFEYYSDKLAGIVDLDMVDSKLYPFEMESSYYFFWVQTPYRDDLALYLKDNGVYTTFRYYPLHKIELFNPKNIDLESANYASDNTLNIPIHHNLSSEDVSRIVFLIEKFFMKKS